MASASLRHDGLIADKPPPSWQRSTSYIKVSADTGSSPDGDSQLISLGRLTSPRATVKVPALHPPPQEPMARQNSTPPTSPVKNTRDDSLQASLALKRINAAATPRTPRLPPPPPPSAASETTPEAGAERQDSLTAPHSGGSGSHRRTTSWGGSPTASVCNLTSKFAGGSADDFEVWGEKCQRVFGTPSDDPPALVTDSRRQPHRRSRSIETLGWGGDAREAYRLELERIGSMDKGSEASSKASTPRRVSVTVVPPADVPVPTSQRRPSLPSPLKLVTTADRLQPPAPAGPSPPLHVKVKASKGEPELISWDEVEAQKDVYEAITTSDGRQALVKAAPGKQAAEEVLFLEEAPLAAAAAEASPVGYALAGAVPMVAVPVCYPDGRVMYHVYPVAQHAAQGDGALSPTASPQVLSPVRGMQPQPSVSSPHFPGSPFSAGSPVLAGHVRRGSLGSLSAPSPLRTNSATSYNVPGAFPSSFAAAASVASPTPSSPVSFGKLQAASSGALSPAMSHSNSGHLIATAVSGAVAFGAMSPAGSGHLYGSPPPVQAYTVPQHAPAAQHFSPPHEGLHQQMASMHVGSGSAGPKDDPFGGSAVWAS